MWKFVLALLLGASVAEAVPVEPNIIGVFSKMNMTEEEYQIRMDSAMESGKWGVSYDVEPEPMKFKFFDSFNRLLMALFVNEADEIILPEVSGEYLLKTLKNRYMVSGTSREPSCLAFGFRKSGGQALKESFDKALIEMKEDGTLAALQSTYLTDLETLTTEPVNFKKFEDARTVKIAVTGDLPPIDMVTENGTPAGFSTALLAEIGRRLHLNITLIDIAAGTRATFLGSKKVDAVFWFQLDSGSEIQPDVPEGVALSEPYYEWSGNLHIRQKQF